MKRPHTRDGRLFAGKETNDQVRRRADEADNCNRVALESVIAVDKIGVRTSKSSNREQYERHKTVDSRLRALVICFSRSRTI